MRYDVAIVGGGPAGVSAAVYAARAGLSVCIIHNNSGSLQKAEKIENYYSVAPLTGKQLYSDGLAQAASFGVEIIDDEILDAIYTDCYELTGKVGKYEALALILATGSGREIPAIKGISDYEGKGVSYCAVCDGFFFRGKNVAVVGSGDYAASEASHLAPLAASVTILTNGNEPAADFGKFTVITDKIAGLYGENRLGGVIFDNGEQFAADGLFAAIGVAGAGALARKLGAELNGSNIAVSQEMATNLPGLYAAGDCTGGLLQVAKAVGDGAKAAISAIKFVKNAKK